MRKGEKQCQAWKMSLSSRACGAAEGAAVSGGRRAQPGDTGGAGRRGRRRAGPAGTGGDLAEDAGATSRSELTDSARGCASSAHQSHGLTFKGQRKDSSSGREGETASNAEIAAKAQRVGTRGSKGSDEDGSRQDAGDRAEGARWS